MEPPNPFDRLQLLANGLLSTTLWLWSLQLKLQVPVLQSLEAVYVRCVAIAPALAVQAYQLHTYVYLQDAPYRRLRTS